MARLEHPGSPGWTGPTAKGTAGPRQEASATGRDLPCPGPEGHLGGLGVGSEIEIGRHSKYKHWVLQWVPREREQLSQLGTSI